ncbi:Maf family protein [Bacillus massiliigorillae]|uniref:Maf family protein n=1 Tax=Bacillus massiliigorillae TaxID=1243664 RepID=UPI0003A80821|nr:Maf family protein [Bacillus massiliigorillae]
MKNLILASASPRRHELLSLLEIPFKTFSSDIDETISPNTAPEEAVQQLALKKAQAAIETHPNSIIIGCDTIVVHNGNILGKPADKADAFHVLSQLSNHTHTVYTGVSIISEDVNKVFYEKTEVTFWELSDQDIEAYIDSGEPMDKAGSYGIQGKAALFVKEIHGDYYSVVGLPISRLARELSFFR